jgi:hypothetical protein
VTSEHIWTDDDRLTWEELQANVACRGCGLPFFDRRRPMPPILRRTPREVAIAAIEEHDWRTRHGDCHAVRHGFAYGPTHCGRCCAPPPMSPEQIQRVVAIMQPYFPAPPTKTRRGRKVS